MAGLIVVLGFILRLPNITQSLWLDEAVQAITSMGSLSGVFSELTGDFHPPLYHLFLWGWVKLFGHTEISLRFPSVLFGTATIYLTYLLAKNILPKPEGGVGIQKTRAIFALPALLLATSQYHVYYSQEARLYTVSAFLACLSSYFFLRLNDRRKAKPGNSFWWYYLSTLLLVYVDYYGWFVVVAQLVCLGVSRRWRIAGISLVAFVVSYLPWLPSLIAQVKNGVYLSHLLPRWAELVNLSVYKAIPLTVLKFSFGRITIPNRQVYLLIGGGVILFFLAILVFGTRALIKSRATNGLYLILWLIVPIVFSGIASLVVPNFQPFRLLLTMPAFYLVVSAAIVSFPVVIARVVAVTILTMNLYGLFRYYCQPYLQREDWRALAAYSDKKNVTLLLPSESSIWPIRYYSPGGARIIFGAPGAEQVSQAPEINGQTVFYLRYLVPIFDPDEKLSNQLLTLGYNKTGEISFNQLEVWVLEKSTSN